MTETTADAEEIGYEQAREELVKVVRTLEEGGVTLEQSLALWERGEHLARVCQSWLDGARDRLEAAIAERDDGDVDRRALTDER